jgi:hypothetical protein
MAALALGLVGGFFFGPVGYLIGSTLGSLLFPPHGQDAQPLQNLKLQGSQYGVMIPISFGTWRHSGQVVWQTDLEPHAQHESSGGKGGDDPISGYTYTVSCAIKVCKGPKKKLTRIWADGELIYDRLEGSTLTNELPIAIYLGIETADPDPTIEAVEGVGNVPAFRDDVAVVFTDWDVTRYGNRIPNLNFEVVSHTGTFPVRLASFTTSTHPASNQQHVTFDEATQTITVAEYFQDTNWYYRVRSYLLDGTPTGTDVDEVLPAIPGQDGVSIGGHVANSDIAFGFYLSDNNAWYVQGQPSVSVGNAVGGHASQAVVGVPVISGDFLYAVCNNAISGTCGVAQFNITEGLPSGIPIRVTTIFGDEFSGVHIAVSDDGFVWVGESNSSSGVHLYKFDDELTLIHQWDAADLPPYFSPHYTFLIYDGYLVFHADQTVNQYIAVYTINADDTFTQAGETQVEQSLGPNIPIGGGLVSDNDGIYTLNPPGEAVTLASIVTEISADMGVVAGAIDVSTLTDLVDGFALTQQTSGRAALDPLRAAYFFDGVESNTQIKFVKRGGSSVVTIPDEDLAATVSGSAPPDPLRTQRIEEELLPAILDLKYVDGGSDYQDGDQRAQRQVTSSDMSVTVSVPVSLSSAKAAQIAWITLLVAWVERESFTLSIPRKYAYLEPTDVITARGRTMRLTKETQTASLLQTFDALAVIPGLFVSAPVGVTGSGFTQTVAPNSQASNLLMLDIPLVSDDDATSPAVNIYYAAMAGAVGPPWPGAVLFKSNDGGTTYASASGRAPSAVMGTTLTALGDFLGGNVFDEGNALEVLVGAGGGTLSSATRLAVLNGANKVSAGKEIFQFRDAELTAPSTYRLTGLLRGRRGTEWAIGTHSSGESFVLLSGALPIVAGGGDLGVTRQFKPVTIGRSVASATAQNFTDFGASLRPYAVVHVGGGVNASGDFIVNWTRRTRIGGEWASYVVAPLSEATESYTVEVWDATFTTLVRTTAGLTTPTLTYTAAQQTTDFGSPQSSIHIKVYQNGQFLPSKAVRATLPNNDPLASTDTLEPNPIPGPPPPLPAGSHVIPFTWSDSPPLVAYSSEYGGFGPTDELIVSFTTPAVGNAVVGNITIVEFGDPQTDRLACLSTTAGDMDNGIKKEAQGPTFFFSVGTPTTLSGYPVPTLLVNTTYYLNIKNAPTSNTSCNVKITLNKPSGL